MGERIIKVPPTFSAMDKVETIVEALHEVEKSPEGFTFSVWTCEQSAPGLPGMVCRKTRYDVTVKDGKVVSVAIKRIETLETEMK